MSSLRTFSQRLRKVFCLICLIIAFFSVVLSDGGYAQSGVNQNPMIIESISDTDNGIGIAKILPIHIPNDEMMATCTAHIVGFERFTAQQ